MNIIFDIGGVALHWSVERFLKNNFVSDKDYNTAYNHILNTPLWTALDKGIISLEEAAILGSKESGLPEKVIQKMMNSISDTLQPINGTIDMFEILKTKGHKLYILSNMAYEIADELEEKYTFWKHFDGIVFSGRIKMIKPDNEIYHYILNKYNLIPSETVFIDDCETNITAANELGIKTIHFKSSEQCRKELTQLNCF